MLVSSVAWILAPLMCLTSLCLFLILMSVPSPSLTWRPLLFRSIPTLRPPWVYTLISALGCVVLTFAVSAVRPLVNACVPSAIDMLGRMWYHLGACVSSLWPTLRLLLLVCLLSLLPHPLSRLFWRPSVVLRLMIGLLLSTFIYMISIMSVRYSRCLGRV